MIERQDRASIAQQIETMMRERGIPCHLAYGGSGETFNIRIQETENPDAERVCRACVEEIIAAQPDHPLASVTVDVVRIGLRVTGSLGLR